MTAVHPRLVSCCFRGQGIESTTPDLVSLGPDAWLWSSLITVMNIVLIHVSCWNWYPSIVFVIRSSPRVRQNALEYNPTSSLDDR